jgi:pre-mRNA cleavage complex 2 protein Pcf11
MDWHFRVHQRIAEAEKRGQHRSWYVDAADWVRSREAVDTDYVAPQGGGGGGGGGGADYAGESATGGGGGGGGTGRNKGAGRQAYIPVPEDPKVNTVCPICQEKFEMKWLDEAQEWVWMDAVKVGDRVYHASCYGEATKGGGSGGGGGNDRGTPARGTPEPVLGKRKAEVS